MAGYRHIQEYEEEMLELKAQGMTVKEIGERYGLTKEQRYSTTLFRNLQAKVSVLFANP
ncbi:MAG: hypothetical protein IKN72_00275 [Clostridia bacterium]|nr:hypothetical protein [Clostridia bacterium]